MNFLLGIDCFRNTENILGKRKKVKGLITYSVTHSTVGQKKKVKK